MIANLTFYVVPTPRTSYASLWRRIRIEHLLTLYVSALETCLHTRTAIVFASTVVGWIWFSILPTCHYRPIAETIADPASYAP